MKEMIKDWSGGDFALAICLPLIVAIIGAWIVMTVYYDGVVSLSKSKRPVHQILITVDSEGRVVYRK